MVVGVLWPYHRGGDAFGAQLVFFPWHGTVQVDFAIADNKLQGTGVDVSIQGQLFAYQFPDTIIRQAKALWALASTRTNLWQIIRCWRGSCIIRRWWINLLVCQGLSLFTMDQGVIRVSTKRKYNYQSQADVGIAPASTVTGKLQRVSLPGFGSPTIDHGGGRRSLFSITYHGPVIR